MADGEGETTTHLLHIALQEGFSGDTVVLRVNGEEVFHKDVSTRVQIGYADSLELDVEEGSVEIEASLPLMALSETIVLQVSAPVYVGISIRNGGIDFDVSDEPFGYL